VLVEFLFGIAGVYGVGRLLTWDWRGAAADPVQCGVDRHWPVLPMILGNRDAIWMTYVGNTVLAAITAIQFSLALDKESGLLSGGRGAWRTGRVAVGWLPDHGAYRREPVDTVYEPAKPLRARSGAEGGQARAGRQRTVIDSYRRVAAMPLNHPNILRMGELQSEGATRFVAMEYAGGGNLRARLAAGAGSEQVPSWSRRGRRACYAMRTTWWHGDLNPDNILFDAQGKPCGRLRPDPVFGHRQPLHAVARPEYMTPSRPRAWASTSARTSMP